MVHFEVCRSAPQYLFLSRHGIYYFRVVVPKHLRLAHLVGFGRMVLAYPELPADVLAGRGMQRKRLCRTFSDCTTAPRNGMVSGCYPLDHHYKKSSEMARLTQVKKAANLA